MGVIRNIPDPFADYVEDALENLIAENEVALEQPALRVRPRKTKQRPPTKPEDTTKSVSRLSGKRHRRFQNATFLLSLSGETPDFGELTIHDFVKESVSAFARVLMEKDDIEVWNAFLNCTEDEQEKCLKAAVVGSSHNRDQSGGRKEILDPRNVHPGCTTDDLDGFRKVESKLRNLLKRKHFPLGNLAYLEDQIVSFFSEWPRGLYTSQLSSFDRLLLHALCQYLDLHSQSFDQKGTRHTKVQNLKDDFQVPGTKLTTYVQLRLGSSSNQCPN